MIPVNNTTRKKMQLRFAIFYIGSLLAVVVILSALFMKRSGGTDNSARQMGMNTTQQKAELEKLVLAKEHINRLQRLDSIYLLRLMNILLRDDVSGLADSIDVVNREMPEAEHALQLLSDNLQKNQGDSLNDQVFTITRNALNNHQNIRRFAARLPALSHPETVISNKGDMAAELMKKEQRILQLEDQLKMQRSVVSSPQLSSLPEKTFNADSSYWSALVASAQNENEKLNRELTKYRNLAAETANGKERQTELTKKITELTNELYLSQVDCNLQRADSKQVIYNSRQRKELLDEALKILNNVSLSANADIQQKVRQKTRTLEAISNTVRD